MIVGILKLDTDTGMDMRNWSRMALRLLQKPGSGAFWVQAERLVQYVV